METNREAVLVKDRISFRRRHRWLAWVGGGLLAVLAGLAAMVAVLAHRAEPFMRTRIVEALQERFRARVELDSFHLSLGNELDGRWGVWAEGKGLRIWPSAKAEGVTVPETAESTSVASAEPAQPLIRLAEFRFHAPLRY